MTAQSYPKPQNTRERKNTKRSVSLVSLATVYSRKKKRGHAIFSVRVCSEWKSCSLRSARLLCPLFSSEHTADCLPPPRAVEELPARQGCQESDLAIASSAFLRLPAAVPGCVFRVEACYAKRSGQHDKRHCRSLVHPVRESLQAISAELVCPGIVFTCYVRDLHVHVVACRPRSHQLKEVTQRRRRSKELVDACLRARVIAGRGQCKPPVLGLQTIFRYHSKGQLCDGFKACDIFLRCLL